MKNPNLIVSTREGAEYIGVAHRTMAEWLMSGKYKIPHIRVGAKYVFDRRDLDVWLTQRKRNTPGSTPHKERRTGRPGRPRSEEISAGGVS